MQDVGHFTGTVFKVASPLQVSSHALTKENWIENNGTH